MCEYRRCGQKCKGGGAERNRDLDPAPDLAEGIKITIKSKTKRGRHSEGNLLFPTLFSFPIRRRKGLRKEKGADQMLLRTREAVSRLLQFFTRCVQPGEASVLDATVAVETGVEDDFQHRVIVEFGLVVFGVPDAVFDGDAFGPGHQFLSAFVGVVAFAILDAEVSEIGEGSAAIMADAFHDFDKPFGVAGKSAVIFDEDVDALPGAILGDLREAVDNEFDLLFPRAAAVGIDADRVAAEKLRGIDPLVVILNCLVSLRLVGVTDVAFAVAHDEEALHAEVGGAFFHFAEVGFVLRFIHEELVHVFERHDAVVGGDFGEIEVVDFAGLQLRVDRPLGEGNFEKRFGGAGGGSGEGERAGGETGLREKFTTGGEG